MLHKILSEKIPIWQDEIRSVIQEKGNQKVGDVIVSQLYGGMRGIKGLTCETSAVSADKGLIIRGYPLLDITHISPEEVFYLLLTGDLPNDDQLSDLQAQLRSHQNIPDYIWKILEAMPKDSHPMTMLTVAIQSMQVDSLFASKYDEGIPKSDYWKWTLEDGIRLVAKVTGIAAGIYRLRFNKGDRIAPDNSMDWSGNFAHMMGIEGDDFKKLMRLYLMLHCDHEGGNVSAFSGLTVASALSSPYLSVAAGLNGLAGPLHGLANQECLKFVLEVRDHFNGAPSQEEMKQFCWDRLNNGRVIPGYGHAVLRCPDPRYTAFMEFGKEHIKDDDVFSIVSTLFDVVPPVLQEQGKAKNPWPNVDAASGSLLYYYGLTEFNYYTVLFSISRAMGMISQMVINRAMGIPITRPKSVTTEWIKSNT
ncbi:MAG: citrate (Si)-synthase [Candidatus Marinimicrobia bacterium]|jgi:citrate synthase|nr:citrate (Si)-synthase [Candidatus Neomarinimicrobiota bacterium]MBT3948299.1 citrate (Si)-synthase [Candidatus Neomarinimicrobiota bacterium]MBT4063638.1 citrate (Si)-synthase [Candidatus Neomarinimicrobiota bacterium]MBT4307897.1 citrate (Si)-synthase [Candidatus Neomarinimicrobiota bacterium]MBT4452830.1 citrate (Si)-synthase [Candidatus Neomarinimicrobiota bacterium]